MWGAMGSKSMDASGTTDGPLIDGLTGLCDAALPAAEGLLAETRQHLTDMVVVDGRAKGALVEKHQTEVHKQQDRRSVDRPTRQKARKSVLT